MNDRPQLLLPRNLAALANLTNKDSAQRFSATTGVQLTRTDEGYRAVATDCRTLGIVDGFTGLIVPLANADGSEVKATKSALRTPAEAGTVLRTAGRPQTMLYADQRAAADRAAGKVLRMAF